MTFQSREDWLKWRKTGIGASDSPVIMAHAMGKKHKYRTIMGLYEDKTNPNIKEERNFASDLGIEAESKINDLWSIKLGKDFKPAVAQNGIFLASYDGRTEDGTEACEIKLSGKEDYQIAMSGKVPDHYMIQVQHQLMVDPKLELIHFAVYPLAVYKENRKADKLELLAHVIVKRIPKIQMDIAIQGTKFWTENVLKRKPPIAESSDFKPLVGVPILANRWKELTAQIEKLKEEQDHVRSQIIARADETGESRLLCAGIKLTKISRVGNVNYKAIPQLVGVNLDEYRGSGTTYWDFKQLETDNASS